MGDVIRLNNRHLAGTLASDRGAATATAPRQPATATSQTATHVFERAGGNGLARMQTSTARKGGAVSHHTKIGDLAKGGGSNAPLDADAVVAQLEAAGRTLLALPGTGYSTKLRVSRLEIVQSALEAFGTECGPVRAAVPSASQISQMDETLGWISLIPIETVARGRPGGGNVLRRIVGARALVGPITERHIYSWRRLGCVLGADHKAVQRWHSQAIDSIVAALNRCHP